MPDITYQVAIDYVTTGSVSKDLDKAHGGAQKLGSLLNAVWSSSADYGSNLVSSFQGAVEHAGSLLATVTKIGAAAGVGAVVYGIGKLNADLESTQIGLAATFNAFGAVENFSEGTRLAADMVEKMRKDAQALPGEFADLKAFFSLSLSPGLQAGKTPAELEKMSATMMATAASLQVPMDQAAREYAMLLGGRAGAHNILGAKLGLTGAKATAFNAESGAKRAEDIIKLTKPFDAALPAMEHSWDGLTSTLRDTLKHALQLGTAAPFEHVKATLERINGWFDNNSARVGRWAQQVGDGLALAWDKGVALAEDWWPTILTVAKELGHELSVIWEKVEPAVSKIAEGLKGALGDGSAMRDLKKIVELYALTKVTGVGQTSAAGSALGGVVGAGIGAMAGNPQAGAAIGGEAGGALGIAGVIAGPLGWAAQKGVEIGLASAIAGGPNQEAALDAMGNLGQATQKLTDDFNVKVLPSLEKFAIANINTATMVIDFADKLTRPIDSLGDYLDTLSGHVGMAGDAMIMMYDKLIRGPKLGADPAMEAIDRSMVPMSNMMAMAGGKIVDFASQQAFKAKGAGPGAGGTHIQKVEIIVSSTQDANRVAEAVEKRLVNIKRHPTVSGSVPNQSLR